MTPFENIVVMLTISIVFLLAGIFVVIANDHVTTYNIRQRMRLKLFSRDRINAQAALDLEENKRRFSESIRRIVLQWISGELSGRLPDATTLPRVVESFLLEFCTSPHFSRHICISTSDLVVSQIMPRGLDGHSDLSSNLRFMLSNAKYDPKTSTVVEADVELLILERSGAVGGAALRNIVSGSMYSESRLRQYPPDAMIGVPNFSSISGSFSRPRNSAETVKSEG